MGVAFTFFAMLTLSWRIACMSPRWYFMTGHCPVTNVWDFAKPRPNRMDREPCFAASSTAPGSPVT